MTRFLLVALACLAAAPLRAETADLRFRGVVEGRDGDRLSIRRAGGSTVTMQLVPTTRIFAAAAAQARDIKPESYVSVVSRGTGVQALRAEQVAVYGPSERGFEAGRQRWDTGPDAHLTAGWVEDLSPGPAPHVTLRYADGQGSFVIPPGTPVTAISRGERAMLVPGAAVTAFTRSGPDGALEVQSVTIGRGEAVPAL